MPPFSFSLRASAENLFMPTAQQVVPPFGFIEFCLSHERDCSGGTDEPALFVLDDAKRREMEAVNAAVNMLPEVSDMALHGRSEFWTYAGTIGGDCEDLALEKRRRLIALGWPADAALIATAKDRSGDGHAVLIASTDKGDFVLDNRTSDIKLWSRTSYKWRARQSRKRPYVWLNIDATKFAATPVADYPPTERGVPFINMTVTASLTEIRPNSPAF